MLPMSPRSPHRQSASAMSWPPGDDGQVLTVPPPPLLPPPLLPLPPLPLPLPPPGPTGLLHAAAMHKRSAKLERRMIVTSSRGYLRPSPRGHAMQTGVNSHWRRVSRDAAEERRLLMMPRQQRAHVSREHVTVEKRHVALAQRVELLHGERGRGRRRAFPAHARRIGEIHVPGIG